jgi:glutathione S-transferase
MKTQLILYTHPLSANGRKTLAVYHLLNLQFEIQLVNVYKGEGQSADFLKINPLGQIPALINISDGNTILESNAILMYICEAFEDHQYYNKDFEIKANIHQWLFWESSQWQPAISTILRDVVGYRLLPDLLPAPTSEPNWDNQQFKRQLEHLELHLSNHDFLVGKRLSIADISVAGMLTYFRFAKFPFNNYPAIKKWYEHIEALPAWKTTEDALWK